jgi:hypothetical protein
MPATHPPRKRPASLVVLLCRAFKDQKMKKSVARLGVKERNPREWARIESLPILREAWGCWLGSKQWTHFGTLTLTHEGTAEALKRQFKRWIRRLEQRSQGRVGWFVAIERSPGGLLHAHALVHGAALSVTDLRKAWPAGRIDLREYDARLGAVYYVTKEMAGPIVDYDISPVTSFRHPPA